MYAQDILRYVGIGLLGLSVVLLILSVVVFVTRDVRGALRFLRGGPSTGLAGTTGERKPMAMHRSRTVTRATRESLAEVESGSGVNRERAASGPLSNGGPKDRSQDSVATMVNDTSQDVLATVVSNAQEDDVPTVVGADDATQVGIVDGADDATYGDAVFYSDAQGDGARLEMDFRMVRSIVLVHAEVDLYVIQGETGARP